MNFALDRRNYPILNSGKPSQDGRWVTIDEHPVFLPTKKVQEKVAHNPSSGYSSPMNEIKIDPKAYLREIGPRLPTFGQKPLGKENLAAQVSSIRANQVHQITGNTFPVREELKAAGLHFDPKTKSWIASSHEQAEKARDIVRRGKVKVERGYDSAYGPEYKKERRIFTGKIGSSQYTGIYRGHDDPDFGH